jgi:hypothetical protein
MARRLTAQNRRELAEQGYTIIPQLIGSQLASAGRQLIDDLLGESDPVPQVDPARYQPGPWPEGEPLRGTGSRLPVLTTGNYRHSICHPICSHVAAELLLPFVALNEELLDCPAERLKLMQQMMVRTDASPPPHAGHGNAPPIGWHMDQAFLPRHYESQPRDVLPHHAGAEHRAARLRALLRGNGVLPPSAADHRGDEPRAAGRGCAPRG